MKKIVIFTVFLCIFLVGFSWAYAAPQAPQWVAGQKLVGVFGVSNGDVLIITSQYNQIIFTYQYADTSKDTLRDYYYSPLSDPFDQVSASVCGRVAHVVTHGTTSGLYALSWNLPISDTQVTYLPIIVCGASWPNN